MLLPEADQNDPIAVGYAVDQQYEQVKEVRLG